MPRIQLNTVPNNERHRGQRSPGIAGGEYLFPGPGSRLADSPAIPQPRNGSAMESSPFFHSSPSDPSDLSPGHSSPATLPTNSRSISANKPLNVPPRHRSHRPVEQYRPVLDNLANADQEGFRSDRRQPQPRSPTAVKKDASSPYGNKLGLMVTSPVDGCLVLGKYPRGPSLVNYYTRYWLDRKQQRSTLTWNVLTEDFFPCCTSKNWTSYARATWSFFRSEAFLFFLFATVVFLGVNKEAQGYRHDLVNDDAATLHLLHSVVECVLANVQIFLRMMGVWKYFDAIKENVRNRECVARNVSVRGRSLRTGVGFYMFTCLLLIGGNIACFIVLYLYVHLGWTLLCHTLSMVLCACIAAVFNQRFDKVKVVMSRDQHKLALYESVLLLRESFVLQGTDKLDYYERADKFLLCFSHTSIFDKPKYIHLLKENVIEWDSYLPQETVTIL